jgi:hypothetical protein
MVNGTFLRRSLNAGLALGVLSIVGRVGVGALSVQSLEGCSITATDGGLILKTQNRYVPAQPVQKQSVAAWTGQPILVHNANGSVTVNGSATATGVTVSAVPFAFADPDKPSDGTQAIQNVTNTLGIDESSGSFVVNCSQATQQYGSAGVSTTGCDLTVTVPAGSASQGVALTAHTGNGDVTAAQLYSAAGVVMHIFTDNGSAKATGITGSATVHSINGNATGSVTPILGSEIEVSSGNGDATLSLPASFACDSLTLSAPGGNVTVGSGFTNTVTSTSTSVGMSKMGASKVTVTAGTLGNASLLPQ